MQQSNLNQITIEVTVKGGKTFFQAACRGNLEVCQYLLQKGAKTQLTNNHGVTALQGVWFVFIFNSDCLFIRKNKYSFLMCH